MGATRAATPDSVYASWSDDQRAAADRMEERYNHDVRLQLAELVHTNYVSVASDDSLQRLAVLYRRQLTDIDLGVLVGGPARACMVRAKISDIEREQQCRSALAECWLASEDGTHCYTAFVSRGGLAAVAHHDAPAPTYHLARILDHANRAQGLPCVMAERN